MRLGDSIEKEWHELSEIAAERNFATESGNPRQREGGQRTHEECDWRIFEGELRSPCGFELSPSEPGEFE